MRRGTHGDDGLRRAAQLPLPEPLRQRIFLGLGLYVPNDAILRADLPTPYSPQFAIIGNRANSTMLGRAARRIGGAAATGAALGGARALGSGAVRATQAASSMAGTASGAYGLAHATSGHSGPAAVASGERGD